MRVGITFDLKDANQDDDERDRASEWSAFSFDDDQEEFDSPATIDAIAGAIAALGHEVVRLGDGEPMLQRLLDGPRPDIVFNIAEGRGVGRAREARVPAVLEMLNIPYTGSDPLTLAATLDKDCAKRLVRAAGVLTPDWVSVVPGEELDWRAIDKLGLPVIVKPAFEGSSKGVRNASLVDDAGLLRERIAQLTERYEQMILVEEFIDGEELTAGLIGNPPEVIAVMRVVPRAKKGPFVYSLEIKRDFERLVDYECPAGIAPAAMEAVRKAAVQAWRCLGCRDVSRFDFRLRGEEPYFLEVNPLPGLSPKTSDLVIAARMMGIEHDDLIRRILQAALARVRLVAPGTIAHAARRR